MMFRNTLGELCYIRWRQFTIRWGLDSLDDPLQSRKSPIGITGNDREIGKSKDVIDDLTVAIKNDHEIYAEAQLVTQLLKQPYISVEPVEIFAIIGWVPRLTCSGMQFDSRQIPILGKDQFPSCLKRSEDISFTLNEYVTIHQSPPVNMMALPGAATLIINKRLRAGITIVIDYLHRYVVTTVRFRRSAILAKCRIVRYVKKEICGI